MNNVQTSQIVVVSFSAEVNPTTSEALLGVLIDLSNKKVKEVHLLLSTPGGAVMSGFNIYNVVRGLPFKFVTHNVGNVDSIGNVIFLAGEERYSSAHSTFMFHGVGFDLQGPSRFDEKILRERTSLIQADNDRIAAIIQERTSLNLDKIRELFLESTTRDPNYALQNGFIHEIREFKLPPGASSIQLVFKR